MSPADPESPPVARPPSATLYYVLGALLAFAALNAFGGGYYGVQGAAGVPAEWLDGSPFADFFFPSLILAVVVGGSLLFAAVVVFLRSCLARAASVAAGVVLFGWIAAQVRIIGYRSWLQPTTAIVAILVLLMAAALPGDPKAAGSRPSPA